MGKGLGLLLPVVFGLGYPLGILLGGCIEKGSAVVFQGLHPADFLCQPLPQVLGLGLYGIQLHQLFFQSLLLTLCLGQQTGALIVAALVFQIL